MVGAVMIWCRPVIVNTTDCISSNSSPSWSSKLCISDWSFQSSSMLESMFDDVKRMDKRQFLYQVSSSVDILVYRLQLPFILQVLSFGMIVSSALMIWKGLMVVTGSESPIVVVLSGSMEPAFQVPSLKSFSFCFAIVIIVFVVSGFLRQVALDFDLILCREETFSSWPTTRRRTSGWERSLSSRSMAETSQSCTGLKFSTAVRIAFTSCCRVLKLHEKEDGSIKFLTKVGVNDFLALLSLTQTSTLGRQQQCRRQGALCAWTTLAR